MTRIIFANYDNTLLAFCSFDGDISVCYALPEPRVHLRIQGHTQCVTGEWIFIVGWISDDDVYRTSVIVLTLFID